MIFYTLQGPGQKLEIHDDKILLLKKSWMRLFSSKGHGQTWEVQGLSLFQISVPKYLMWGKIEWRSFDGTSGSFRFSSNATMVKKIELYLQKRIIKNHHRMRNIPIAKKVPRKPKPAPLGMAA